MQDVQKEMEILTRAEQEGEAVAPVSDRVPGGLALEDAHRICEGILEQRLAAGERLSGYKVGFTNVAVREKMGLPDSTYGYILDSMVLQSGGDLSMARLIAPKIECEICFKLGEDLAGEGLSEDRVLQATEGVCAAFEVCDSRIKAWSCPYPDYFADNGFSCRVVLPGHWKEPSGVDLLQEEVVLQKDGEEVSRGKGEAAMGHPARAVAWLAGKLAQRGKGLQKGQFVMTGTLTPILPVDRGSVYVATFSTLGEVRLRFV